jgi:hypothetical protein
MQQQEGTLIGNLLLSRQREPKETTFAYSHLAMLTVTPISHLCVTWMASKGMAGLLAAAG